MLQVSLPISPLPDALPVHVEFIEHRGTGGSVWFPTHTLLGWIRNALGGLCGPSSFTVLKRILGMDRKSAVWEGGSHVLWDKKEGGQGPLQAGSHVQGVAEAMGSSPHSSDAGPSAEPWCSSAYT